MMRAAHGGYLESPESIVAVVERLIRENRLVLGVFVLVNVFEVMSSVTSTPRDAFSSQHLYL